MLKNITTIAVGLLLASGLTLGAKVAFNVLNPYKQEDRIKDLPAFSLSQDYAAENEFEALVRLESAETTFEDQQFVCSGTIISDDYMLTAAHCVGGTVGKLSKEKLLVISMANQLGETLTVEAVAASMNGRADYAVVKGDFRRFKKLRILPNMEHAMAKVFAIPRLLTCGFPWGAEDACYTAEGSQPYFEGIAMRGLLYPGMSGGPVIDPESKIVVAVNSAMAPGGAIVISPLVGIFQTLHIKVVP